MAITPVSGSPLKGYAIQLMLKVSQMGKCCMGLFVRSEVGYMVDVPTNNDEAFLLSWLLYSFCPLKNAPKSVLGFKLNPLMKLCETDARGLDSSKIE